MLVASLCAVSAASSAEPLQLEAKIPLGPVEGRIDHLTYDSKMQLLFVAELGNNSVGIVDLKAGKLLSRLHGLSEPQGIAYHARTTTLYVANAGDGSLRFFQAYQDSSFFAPAGALALGDDADNIRFDSRRDRMVVGYGRGALALIDPANRRKLGDIPLKGHPEGFQFDETGERIFVNVPEARQIAVVDVKTQRQTGSLDLGGARSNFPMALDAGARRLLVVSRNPAKLLAFASLDGKPVAASDTCGDADDVFVDGARMRIYVTCGQGMIDIVVPKGEGYDRLARVPTSPGARTSLFVPSSERLYVAVRASSSEPAAIWVYRTAP